MYHIALQMLNHPFIPRINPTWSRCMNFSCIIILSFFYSSYFFFSHSLQDFSFPGIEPRSWQWKHQVLTTGLPGKFSSYITEFSLLAFCWGFISIMLALSNEFLIFDPLLFLILFYFWEEFEKDWYSFFLKYLVKLTSKVIWFWKFFC